MKCADCGGDRCTSFNYCQQFVYDDVELKALVKMHKCDACGLCWTCADAEKARHEVICKHLGILSPGQIKEIRSKTGLSQVGFARLTGIGEASIKRWESGRVVQNESMDNFLRLLRYPENIERLPNPKCKWIEDDKDPEPIL
jgi:putative zinc finger/helix-turn-helix YgiT family protein